MYRSAAILRRQTAFRNNSLEYCISSDDILSYKRADGGDTYLVTMNLGDNISTDDYSTFFPDKRNSEIVLITPGSNFKEGPVDLKKITLNPGDGLVVHIAK